MPTFELMTKWPRVKCERASIYQLASPRADRKSLVEVARRFGLSGDKKTGSLYEDARLTTYSEGSREVVIHHASGGVRFHDKARWQVDDGVSHVEFDDATATRMARRYVEAHEVVALSECKVLRVTRLNVGTAEVRTRRVQERVIDVGVAFTRVVDGIPVEGPGGKVMVYIDHKGELTGIDRLWRSAGKVRMKSVPLRSPEAVQEEAVRQWTGPGSGRVTVEDARFGYFEHGWDVSQRYLQPAYVLSLAIMATEGHSAGRLVARSEFWGAAAEKSPERLAPRKSKIEPQASRRSYRSRDTTSA